MMGSSWQLANMITLNQWRYVVTLEKESDIGPAHTDHILWRKHAAKWIDAAKDVRTIMGINYVDNVMTMGPLTSADMR